MSETNNTNTKTKSTKAKTAKKKADSPPKTPKTPKATKNPGKAGRPNYNPVFPNKDEWTVKDFMIANEVDPETGKGPKCAKLTLIMWLAKDAKKLGHSIVKRLTTKTKVEDGVKGRKPFLFSLRKKPAKVSIPVDSTPESSPESAPETIAADITVPVVDITPVAEPTTSIEPVVAETSAEITPDSTPEVVPTDAVPAEATA